MILNLVFVYLFAGAAAPGEGVQRSHLHGNREEAR